jgi:hypothetical protein
MTDFHRQKLKRIAEPKRPAKTNCLSELPNYQIELPNQIAKLNYQIEFPNRNAKLNYQTELPN